MKCSPLSSAEWIYWIALMQGYSFTGILKFRVLDMLPCDNCFPRILQLIPRSSQATLLDSARLSWHPPTGIILSVLLNIGPYSFKTRHTRWQGHPLLSIAPWLPPSLMWDPGLLYSYPLSRHNVLVVGPLPDNRALHIGMPCFEESALIQFLTKALLSHKSSCWAR